MIFLTVETAHMLQMKCLHAQIYMWKILISEVMFTGSGAVRRWSLFHECRDSVDWPTDDRKTLESCLVSSIMQENSENTPTLSKDGCTYHTSSLHTLQIGHYSLLTCCNCYKRPLMICCYSSLTTLN